MLDRARWLALGLLVAALAPRAPAQDAPLFTSDFAPEEFARRRGAVYDALGRDGVAIVPGAPSPASYARFRQSNDFYYLSGVEVPHAYLALNGRMRRATLFLPHRNERREQGEGKVLSAEDADEIRRLSGIDAVAPLEALAEQLARGVQMGARTLYLPLAPAEGMAMSRDLGLRAVADQANDPWDGRPSREGRFVELLRQRFPTYEVKDLSPTLDELRLIKSPAEIALIKKSTRLACLAIEEAMRSTVPGLYEYELDGLAKFIFFRHGAQGESYYSLIASGPNAWYPHYSSGKRRMQDGELLLMDFAPDVGYYQSDITRMWPVGGRFSPEQRELYTFYLRTYRAFLAAIRPGRTAAEILRASGAGWDEILRDTRFSKPEYEKAARVFVDAHKLSGEHHPMLGHWVGMAVHDDGPYEGPLRPGMVFTIEPQFRVPEEKIYIRLEDLIVVTEKGIEIVSDWLPSDVEAIEKKMQEDGLLQRYPRDAQVDAR
jgi:Xaa-Pro aminopeptidase